MHDFTHYRQYVLQGARRRIFGPNEVVPLQALGRDPITFTVKPTTYWHSLEVRDQPGVLILTQIDGYEYELFLSAGMLRGFLDMQEASQKETDQWLRDHKEG